MSQSILDLMMKTLEGMKSCKKESCNLLRYSLSHGSLSTPRCMGDFFYFLPLKEATLPDLLGTIIQN